jgi:hypothetical protein
MRFTSFRGVHVINLLHDPLGPLNRNRRPKIIVEVGLAELDDPRSSESLPSWPRSRPWSDVSDFVSAGEFHAPVYCADTEDEARQGLVG